jgi:Na+/H+ antiporter NhaD/arsenite permease-like protein
VCAAIGQAAGQAWPPFVLVAGLILIGTVVEADGLFAALGARIERVAGGPVSLLATLLGLEAIVTAVLNLDTAVVFLTPVIIHAARRRGCDERPVLYGALFMANGASLLLPGSNLTNLIVLAHEPVSGAEFARAIVLPWLVVAVLTIGFMALAYRLRGEGGMPKPLPPLRIGIGAAATATATGLMLALQLAVLVSRRSRRRMSGVLARSGARSVQSMRIPTSTGSNGKHDRQRSASGGIGKKAEPFSRPKRTRMFSTGSASFPA